MRKLGQGLVAAALVWLLGAALAEGFYTRVLALNTNFWDVLWAHNPAPTAAMGFGALFFNLIRSAVAAIFGVIGGGLLIVLLIVSWLAYWADRFYLFPVVGFFLGMGATGWFARIVEAPVKVTTSVAKFTGVSAADTVAQVPRTDRVLGVLGVLIGVGFFVGAGVVLVPLIRRGPVHTGPGEAVVRYLPTDGWNVSARDRNWSWRLIEVSATQQRVEVAFTIKNISGREQRIGIDRGRTRLVPVDSPSRLPVTEPAYASTGVALLPKRTVAVPNGRGVVRLSFSHPGNLEQRWGIDLVFADGRAGLWRDRFLIDLRKSP